MGLGLLALSTLSRSGDIVLTEFASLSTAVGLGFNTGPLLSVAVSAAPKAHAGAAAGVVNTARMIGATLGVAVLGGIFAAHASQNPVDPERIVAGRHWGVVGGAIRQNFWALTALRRIPPRAFGSVPPPPPAPASSRPARA